MLFGGAVGLTAVIISLGIYFRNYIVRKYQKNKPSGTPTQ